MPNAVPTVPHRRTCPTRFGGFTLVEALTVMVVVVALVGFALPTLDVTRFRLDDEVESIALMVTSARRLAVLRHHDIVLAFDRPGARIRLHHDRDSDGTVDSGEEVRFIRLRAEFVFGSGGAAPLVPGPATVSFVAVQDGLPSVTFRENGSASESGVIYLTTREASADADLREYARAIEVDARTGVVTCMSYRTSTWEVAC
jgi:Tfp pilus assembly protein FimT